MADNLRIVMLGTGDFALPTFELLLETGHAVVALITQPDRPQGRRQELIPSKIKLAAHKWSVRVEQPEQINAPEGLEQVRALAPDLLVTAAYGQILSADVLSIASRGGINLHGSILPSLRGAAPVARAIQQGMTETGISVIRMSPRIDAGGVIATAHTSIGPNETAGELEERLARLGAPVVVECIDRFAEGDLPVIKQDRSLVTRAPKLQKDDGLIDWNQPALVIHNLVRAMNPWPRAYSTFGSANAGVDSHSRLIVHKTAMEFASGSPGIVIEAALDRLVVAAGEGSVRLLEVQVPGKRIVSGGEFMRGYRVKTGDRLGAAIGSGT